MKTKFFFASLAAADGIGCGELSCDNGNRARTAGSVSTGYTLTYSKATGN